jgi:hypothetical protein
VRTISTNGSGSATPRLSGPVRFALSLLLLVPVVTVQAASLFDADAVIDVTLTGPMQYLVADRARKPQAGFVLQAEGKFHAVTVRTRGNSRLKLCSFPLLRLQFNEDDTLDGVFEGQDKLKLVTHCRNYRSSQVDLLQEYAAYRIFELISDVAYKTRLLRITFRDTANLDKGDALTRYAFVLESEGEFENRVGAVRQRVAGISPGSINARQAALTYIFHYLIGNTDWSLVTADSARYCCHNGHLFQKEGQTYIVPNDFDLSGLVNARYAKPHPAVGVSRVTQRRYRGYCLSREALSDALASIRSKQEQILGVFEQIPGLDKKDIEKSNKYLRIFFEQAREPNKLLAKFESCCLE